MPTILTICDEKVDSDCSIDCSSPMSAKISSNTHNSDVSDAGMCSPDCAISEKSPSVFIVTVLPPVFGPVMTSVPFSPPSLIVTGTTLCLSSSG